MQGRQILPDVLIPEYNEEMKCSVHDRAFLASTDKLHKESQNIIVYTEMCEKMYDIPVYARQSVGPCKCLQRFDGTKLLLWYLGKGRFIEFTLLYAYMHKWIHSGITIYALWKSIVNTALSCGISSTLTYSDLHRAITGFFNNLEIDLQGDQSPASKSFCLVYSLEKSLKAWTCGKISLILGLL